MTRAHRRIVLFAIIGLLGSLNAVGTVYLIFANRNIVQQNCKANDNQNKILVTLINESLAPVEGKGAEKAYAKLTHKQKHAVHVFQAQRKKLTVPTCD